jgi:hypothetical protein
MFPHNGRQCLQWQNSANVDVNFRDDYAGISIVNQAAEPRNRRDSGDI